MKIKKALIFGITGQDGAYLTNFLIKKKYKVFGVTRNKKKNNFKNLIRFKVYKYVSVYLLIKPSQEKVNKLINKISPDEIYYLSGISSVVNSFKDPVNAYLSNNLTLFYILESVRKINPKIKIYNSASSECFGNNKKIYCDEKTVFNPVNPYGRAKAFSFWLTKYYREMFGIKASNGILFNHESPLRTKNFVTQKIVNYARNYKRGDKKLILGNTNVYRDWGWANEYVKIIYRINSNNKNDDYVIGTGKYRSLLEFIKIVFNEKKIPHNMIKNSKKFERPNEIKKIAANSNKLVKEFKWKPKYNLNDIALKMLNKEFF